MSNTIITANEITLPPLRTRILQSLSTKPRLARLKDFEVIEKLGQGTFGVVQKAKDKQTGDLVAIKQLLNHSAKEGFPITALREITILKQLHHENVLSISKIIFEEPRLSNPEAIINTRGCFYTVSHYMSSDLVGLLENPNVNLKLTHIKCIMEQLLTGINYIHQQRYLHRDIKAANILIDSAGVLKIADFGLARVYHGHTPELALGPGGGERNYTGLVVTRWYRPPELLLGERKYTTAVDMWGIGCVFAELFTRKPILVGQSDAHQAQLVFGLVGSPASWTHAASLPNKNDYAIGLNGSRTLESKYEGIIPEDGIRLLSGLLTLDPYKRYNALDALNHEFFRNEPLPMRPEELPKFEESHEIDKERFKKLRESIKSGYQSTTVNANNNNNNHSYVTPFGGEKHESSYEQSTGAKTSEPQEFDYGRDNRHDTYIPKSRSNHDSYNRTSNSTNGDGESERNPRNAESSISTNHREYYLSYSTKPAPKAPSSNTTTTTITTTTTTTTNTTTDSSTPTKPSLPGVKSIHKDSKTPGSNLNSPTADKFLKVENGFVSNRSSPYVGGMEGISRPKTPKLVLQDKEGNVTRPSSKSGRSLSSSGSVTTEEPVKVKVEAVRMPEKRKPAPQEKDALSFIKKLHLKSPRPKDNDSGSDSSASSKSSALRKPSAKLKQIASNVSSKFANKDRKRPLSQSPTEFKKKARFEVDDDSDLSEGEDIDSNDAKTLSDFLDRNAWIKEPEYRKFCYELIRFQSSEN
ncbi:Serine/threonine-protein kinase BUR1 [Scheffersomyces coipomensis]|uniref:Serine/threonine-protein kinase BUR1 n=1 Tax=Scheffersomyces coipomensis TaxID=1788519 RepID=UPI00315DEE3F